VFLNSTGSSILKRGQKRTRHTEAQIHNRLALTVEVFAGR